MEETVKWLYKSEIPGSSRSKYENNCLLDIVPCGLHRQGMQQLTHCPDDGDSKQL
jgi:hypothetical protein